MKAILPNKADLDDWFVYDAEIGRLRWKKSPSFRAPVGAIAGSRSNRGYRGICFKSIKYPEHRVIWVFCTGQAPADEVDHINGIRDDNRIENLRVVTRKTNMQNQRSASPRNSTGLLGVSRKGDRFRAIIGIDGRQTFLGVFETAAEAHQAYIQAKRQLHEGCTI